MEDNTNADTTPDEQGNNDVSTAGSANTSGAEKNDDKRFTQEDINKIIKQKQAEWSTKYKKDFEKQLEGKHVLADDDLTKLRTDWETEYKAKAAIDIKKAEYKAKGLTDEQLAVVPGDTADDFAKHVEKIFGTLLKKQAPQINPGNPKQDVTENEDTNTWLRQGLKRRKV